PHSSEVRMPVSLEATRVTNEDREGLGRDALLHRERAPREALHDEQRVRAVLAHRRVRALRSSTELGQEPVLDHRAALFLRARHDVAKLYITPKRSTTRRSRVRPR